MYISAVNASTTNPRMIHPGEFPPESKRQRASLMKPPLSWPVWQQGSLLRQEILIDLVFVHKTDIHIFLTGLLD